MTYTHAYLVIPLADPKQGTVSAVELDHAHRIIHPLVGHVVIDPKTCEAIDDLVYDADGTAREGVVR